EAARPVGVEGAVVSAGVVTDKGADGADALPAASRAATVKVYGVLGESPLRDAEVPAAEATSVASQNGRAPGRATLSVAALQVRVNEVAVSAEAARPVGVEGAVVSAGVVTDKGADGADALPAASRAATVKVYGVLGESPLRDAEVPAAEATSVASR